MDLPALLSSFHRLSRFLGAEPTVALPAKSHAKPTLRIVLRLTSRWDAATTDAVPAPQISPSCLSSSHPASELSLAPHRNGPLVVCRSLVVSTSALATQCSGPLLPGRPRPCAGQLLAAAPQSSDPRAVCRPLRHPDSALPGRCCRPMRLKARLHRCLHSGPPPLPLLRHHSSALLQPLPATLPPHSTSVVLTALSLAPHSICLHAALPLL